MGAELALGERVLEAKGKEWRGLKASKWIATLCSWGFLLPHPQEKAKMSFTVLQETFLGLAKIVRLFQRTISSTGLFLRSESSVCGLSKRKEKKQEKRKEFLHLFFLDYTLFSD